MVDGFIMGVGIALGIVTVIVAVGLSTRLYLWADYKMYWFLRRREARKQKRD